MSRSNHHIAPGSERNFTMSDTNTNFFKLSNTIIEDKKFQGLSDSAFRLLIYLKQKEHRFGKKSKRKKEDGVDESVLYFWRTDSQISEDIGKNIKTVKKAKKELIEAGFIKTELMPYSIIGDEGKIGFTKKHVTVYYLQI